MYFTTQFCCYPLNSGDINSYNYSYWDKKWGVFNLIKEGGRLFGTWYLGSGSTAVTSDKNKKNSIGNMGDNYDILFNNLKPIKYKYIEGTSQRFHVGFIAQDVE
jgi:hypothetical protein